jgi:hypothetical protein
MNILVESLALKGKTNIMTYFIDIPEFIIRCVYIGTVINYIPVFNSKLRFETVKILHRIITRLDGSIFGMICTVMSGPYHLLRHTAWPGKALLSCELLVIPAAAAAGTGYSYITKCTQNTHITEITHGRPLCALALRVPVFF